MSTDESGILEVQGDVQACADASNLLVGGDDGLAAADGAADALASLGMQHSRGMLQFAVHADDAALAVGLNGLSAQDLSALLSQQLTQVLAVLGQLAQVFLPHASIRILDDGRNRDSLDGLAAAVALDGHIGPAFIEDFFHVGYDFTNLGLFHDSFLLVTFNFN